MLKVSYMKNALVLIIISFIVDILAKIYSSYDHKTAKIFTINRIKSYLVYQVTVTRYSILI